MLPSNCGPMSTSYCVSSTRFIPVVYLVCCIWSNVMLPAAQGSTRGLFSGCLKKTQLRPFEHTEAHHNLTITINFHHTVYYSASPSSPISSRSDTPTTITTINFIESSSASSSASSASTSTSASDSASAYVASPSSPMSSGSETSTTTTAINITINLHQEHHTVH